MLLAIKALIKHVKIAGMAFFVNSRKTAENLLKPAVSAGRNTPLYMGPGGWEA
jgi:hypothetical protein